KTAHLTACTSCHLLRQTSGVILGTDVRLSCQVNPDNGDEGLSYVRIAVFRCRIVCLLTPATVQFGRLSLKTQLWETRVMHRGWGMMPSILVVDDEQQIRQLIRETLEQAGYHVMGARDGKEALQHYRLAPTDVVIMDILM